MALEPYSLHPAPCCLSPGVQVVRIILLAHAGAVGASLLLSIWVLITANRAKAKLQRDLSLLDRMRAQHRSRQSFVIQSPIASHKIASVFR